MTNREVELTTNAIRSTLKELRQKEEKTLSEVGKAFGYTRQRIESLERTGRGVSTPTTTTLLRMCNYYGLSLVEFFKLVEKKVKGKVKK